MNVSSCCFRQRTWGSRPYVWGANKTRIHLCRFVSGMFCARARACVCLVDLSQSLLGVFCVWLKWFWILPSVTFSSEWVLHIPQMPKTGASSSYGLLSYPGYSLGRLTPLQRFSRLFYLKLFSVYLFIGNTVIQKSCLLVFHQSHLKFLSYIQVFDLSVTYPLQTSASLFYTTVVSLIFTVCPHRCYTCYSLTNVESIWKFCKLRSL